MEVDPEPIMWLKVHAFPCTPSLLNQEAGTAFMKLVKSSGMTACF